MTDEIVDYVEVINDKNGKYRVRGRSNNGEIIWTSEQYHDLEWAQKVAYDTGKEVRGLGVDSSEEPKEGNLEKDVDGTPTTPVQRPDPAE